MKRSLCFSLVLGAAVALGWFFGQAFERAFEEVPAHADAAVAGEQGQGGGVVSGNGDVNGDGGIDLSDAVYTLAFLFQGGPAPLPCPGGGGDCSECEAELLVCRGGVQEICDDGDDNDGDCAIDCADSDCIGGPDCPVVAGFVFVIKNEDTELDEYLHVGTGIEFVLLPDAPDPPDGTFQMGSPPGEADREADPVEVLHTVALTSFLIAKYEVTQAEYEAVMTDSTSGLDPTPSDATGPNLPVEQVSWDDLKELDGFLARTGLSLPTEAQWEYACRAGTPGPYAGNGLLDAMGWYAGNSDTDPGPGEVPGTHLVGTRQANQFGLYDMHGNVWEWCEDVYRADFYAQLEAAGPNPVSTTGSTDKVIRGGAIDTHPDWCRSAHRHPFPPGSRVSPIGFRPAAPAPSP